MKKQEMLIKATNLFNSYKHIFDEAKITTVSWGRWIESFKSYDDIKKAYVFLFGSKRSFASWVMFADMAYRALDPKASLDILRGRWKRLQLMSKTQKQIVELKEAISLVEISWKQKPKRKRGSE